MQDNITQVFIVCAYLTNFQMPIIFRCPYDKIGKRQACNAKKTLYLRKIPVMRIVLQLSQICQVQHGFLQAEPIHKFYTTVFALILLLTYLDKMFVENQLLEVEPSVGLLHIDAVGVNTQTKINMHLTTPRTKMQKLLLFLVAVVCTLLLFLLIISAYTSLDDRPPERYDLLVNAYQNGGSRFTSNLFGFRPDAFYFYEPLWRFSVQEYFRSPGTVCSILNNTCRNSTVGDLMTDVFADIFRCNFSRISSLVQQQVTDNLKYAGPSWRRYTECRYSKRQPRDICLPMQALYCSNFRHLVVKTLRITTDSLGPLLDRKPDLKVIQLFRNPFAIMNSRLESSFQSIVSDFVEMGESLCRKMEIDYQWFHGSNEEAPWQGKDSILR
ncbi:CHST5-like protein [Mya arenaria]|uniref:CHST5-like protein n=1 Tax=Mya arenaria TaxID=6604 RepID=A0ABY7EF05_MYAAR|nr:CHST5-like protein [Mya arenaria]